MARHKDANWDTSGTNKDWGGAQLDVLMDIRDELKQLNRTLSCYRVQQGMDAMIRAERRLATRISLRPKKRGRK